MRYKSRRFSVLTDFFVHALLRPAANFVGSAAWSQPAPGVPALVSAADEKSVEYLLQAALHANYPRSVLEAAILKFKNTKTFLPESPSTLPRLNALPPFTTFQHDVKALPSDWERARYIVEFTYQHLLYGWMKPLQGQSNLAYNTSELNRMSAPELYDLVKDNRIMGVCSLFSYVANRLLAEFGIQSIICNPSITGRNGDVRGHSYLQVYVSISGRLEFVPMDPTSGCYWIEKNGAPMTFESMYRSLHDRSFSASSRVKIVPSARGMFAEPGWGIFDFREPDESFLYDVADQAFGIKRGDSTVFGTFCVVSSARDLSAWELEEVNAKTYIAYAVEQGYPSVWEYVAGLAGLKSADWEHNVPNGLAGRRSIVNLFIQDYKALAVELKNRR